MKIFKNYFFFEMLDFFCKVLKIWYFLEIFENLTFYGEFLKIVYFMENFRKFYILWGI